MQLSDHPMAATTTTVVRGTSRHWYVQRAIVQRMPPPNIESGHGFELGGPVTQVQRGDLSGVCTVLVIKHLREKWVVNLTLLLVKYGSTRNRTGPS